MAGIGGMLDPFTAGLFLTALAKDPTLAQRVGLDTSQMSGLGMGPGMQQLQSQQSQGPPIAHGSDALIPTFDRSGGTPALAAPVETGGPTAASAGEVLPWERGGGPAQPYNPGLQGVKAPAPVTPIMSGGVPGGVKAPEVTAKMGQGSTAIQALLAALLGGPAPERVQPLGAYARPTLRG